MTYLQPFFPLLLIATVAGIFVPRPFFRRFFCACAIALFFFAWPPFSWVLQRPFEAPFSNRPPADRSVQAIVVLASAVFPPTPPRPTAILGTDTYERVKYAAWLEENWVHVPVLASGGGSSAPRLIYASKMSEVLREEGIPASMIWTEGKSRTTYESAEFSAKLLRARNIHKVMLVTEAYHMLRAELCFRKQGFEVVPAACGFRTTLWWTKEWLYPGWEPISWNEQVLHEAIGLLWYKLAGRI